MRFKYFSNTGNSLFEAKKIKDSLKDTEIIKNTDNLLKNNILINFNKLGFIFPVHSFVPPVIIKKLLKCIKNIDAKYQIMILKVDILKLAGMKSFLLFLSAIMIL